MEAVFLKILNMSITAGWLVLVVVLLRLLLKKAPKALHCVLWVLVAVRLLCPFSFESVLSLIPSAETVPADIIYETTPTVDTGIPVVDSVVNPIISQSFSPATGDSINPLQILSFIAAWVWIIGIFCMILYTVISYLRLRKKVAEAIPLRDTIWLCDRIGTPFILGILRPRIYLPSYMNEQDMAYVLAHENAHLKRRDHWWKPIGFALLTVYWFHPLLWLAYILLCKDIELACDERVIKEMGIEDKKAYSGALLSCSVPRRMIAACPLAFGEVSVKSRIKSVLHYKKPAFWVIIVAVVAAAVTAVCFLTDPVRKGPPPQKGTDIITLKSGTDLEGISLEIVSISFAEDNPRLTVKWMNSTDTEATFGEEFYILRKVGETWTDCRDAKNGYAWNDIAWILEAGGETKKEYYIGDMHLKTGETYRFESAFHVHIDGENLSCTVWIEFELLTADEQTDDTQVQKNDEQLKEDDTQVQKDNEQPTKGETQTSQTTAPKRQNNTKLTVTSSGSEVEGVSLGVVSADFDEGKPQLVIKWKNATLSRCGFGEEFYIYRKENGTWVDCRATDPPYHWKAILLLIFPMGNIEKNYSIKDIDMDTDGIYRFESGCSATVNGQSVSGKIWIEFELQTTDTSSKEAEVSVVDTTVASAKEYSFSYKDSPEEFLDPLIILEPDTQTFSFNYSLFSSYLPRGDYSITHDEEQLILRTQDDYERVYVFDIQDDTLVFNAEASSPMPRYKYDGADGEARVPVPDGAVFKPVNADEAS